VTALAAAAFAVAIASALLACGDDDDGSAPARPDGGDAGDVVVVPGTDAAPIEPADAGAFSIEDVADTPCSATTAQLREVYAPNATNLRPLDMIAVGARRAVRVDDGFVLMDADGANASPAAVQTPFSAAAIASTPATLFALGGAGFALDAARFDASGASQGTTSVAGVTRGFGGGGGDGAALIAWVEGNDLRAEAFADDGKALAPPFTFRSSVTEVDGATFAVAHAGGSEFGVAYTGHYAGTHRLVFTRVSKDERLSTSWTLLVGPSPLRLVGLAHVGPSFALLVERRTSTASETLLFTLDAKGRFAGPVRRLLGVRRAFGVASSGGEIGVVTLRARAGEPEEPDAVELRPFDATGAPLAPWVCLDAPFPAATIDIGAAVLGEASGYSVVMRTPAHAVSLVRVDRRGNGS
jgi:hypothetical protein